MALLNCKECEHEISDTAAACPSCGAKALKITESNPISLGIVVFIIGLIVYSCASGDTTLNP